MKVKKSSPTKPTMNEEIHTTVSSSINIYFITILSLWQAMDHILTGLEDIIGHFGHNRLRVCMLRFITDQDSVYF